VSRDHLLGLDVGTTSCKAALVTRAGAEVAHGSAPTPWEVVPTGAELDPLRLLDAALEAIRGALRSVPGARVVALGVSSMAETGVLLDAGGAPLARAIAWYDTRGDDEAQELLADLGGERFTARTGLSPSSLPSVVKYRWLRRHEPAAARGARWLNVAEWIVFGLGGDPPAELSLASRTGFLDVERRRPWDEALAWAQAPAALLAAPAPAGTPAGRARGVEELDGAVLTVAGHDHLCAAVGSGATRPGDLFDSCGSAEALVRGLPPNVTEADVHRAVAGGVSVGWHVVPDQRALLGGFQSGLVLQRAPDAVALRAALEETQARAAAIKATIEAVAGPTERLVVGGGWARDSTMLAVKRAALGAFERPPVTEAGARGAALLGGIAARIYRGVDELPEPSGYNSAENPADGGDA
jgi:sugar (pentulose or hexulose) kinase